MDSVDDEMRRNGLQVCKQFLAGTWKDCELADFHMERIRGGLSNFLYMCSLSDKIKLRDGEQRTVLLRLYGQIIQENPETVLTDSVIYALLAEKTMGPQLYGVFTGGRVEEYVPSRVLATEELHKASISTACARIMAQFHKLTMPIVKEPRWLFDTMTRYLDEALNNVTFAEMSASKLEKHQRLLNLNLSSELDSLRCILKKVHSPVVFCHNDLQEGNILFVEDGRSWRVKPIDFEYASYNYRGFDIGNHFCEWCYNYKSAVSPYFTAVLEDYPTREQQLLFIRAYLREYHSADLLESSSGGGDSTSEDEEKGMLLEVNAFALASHFLWGLWGIVQSHISDIEFGYLDYSLARFSAYFQQKKQLQLENGRLLNGNDFHNDAIIETFKAPHIINGKD